MTGFSGQPPTDLMPSPCGLNIRMKIPGPTYPFYHTNFFGSSFEEMSREELECALLFMMDHSKPVPDTEFQSKVLAYFRLKCQDQGVVGLWSAPVRSDLPD